MTAALPGPPPIRLMSAHRIWDTADTKSNKPIVRMSIAFLITIYYMLLLSISLLSPHQKQSFISALIIPLPDWMTKAKMSGLEPTASGKLRSPPKSLRDVKRKALRSVFTQILLIAENLCLGCLCLRCRWLIAFFSLTAPKGQALPLPPPGSPVSISLEVMRQSLHEEVHTDGGNEEAQNLGQDGTHRLADEPVNRIDEEED